LTGLSEVLAEYNSLSGFPSIEFIAGLPVHVFLADWFHIARPNLRRGGTIEPNWILTRICVSELPCASGPGNIGAEGLPVHHRQRQIRSREDTAAGVRSGQKIERHTTIRIANAFKIIGDE
jgi:hypothetical protein